MFFAGVFFGILLTLAFVMLCMSENRGGGFDQMAHGSFAVFAMVLLVVTVVCCADVLGLLP